jgi:hypothetical protein
MDNRKTNPFSLSVAENDYFNNSQEKIQVTKCRPDGISCKSHLNAINNSFLQSSYYYQNKDYRRAIEALESAFEGTVTIQSNTCSKCVNVFRTTIIETLTNYHDELKSMSSGIFRKRRFIQDYELADNVLNAFQNRQNLQRETKIIKMRKYSEQSSGIFAHVSPGI